MSCIFINKKTTQWKNFVASVGSEKEAVERYVIAGNKIPDSIEKPKTESLRYEGLVVAKRQELEFIQSRITSLEYKKKSASLDDVVAIQQDINIFKKLENKTISEIDTLSNSEVKAQALPAIQQYAESDLAEIRDILSSATIDADLLSYASNKLKVWQYAGDFSGEHPYMSKAELALVGGAEPNVFDEYVGNFTKWKQEADILQNRVVEISMELTDKHLKNTLKFSNKADYEELPKINSLFKGVIGISEINSSLIQALQATLSRAEYETKKEADVVWEKIGSIMGNLRKKNKEKAFVELIKQRDKKGRATRNLVSWTSAEFTNIRRKISEKYYRELDNIESSTDPNKDQKRRDAEDAYNRELREIENGINPHLLFSDDESVSTKYIEELRSALGYEIADILVKDSFKKLKQFQHDREIYESSLSDEDIIQLSNTMSEFDAKYSPYKVYDKRFDSKIISGSLSNISNKYLVSFPRVNVKAPNGDSVKSGYYDENFKKIIKDPEFNEAYFFIVETLQKLNSIVPNSKMDFLDAKTLPDLGKTLIESAFSDGVGATIESVFDRLKESIRTSNINSVLDDTKLMPDGTIKKELQYNFVGNKRKEVGDYITLKTIQYKQQNGTNPPIELVDEWVADKNNELANDMSWDLERVLKAYSLSALGYKNKARVDGTMRMLHAHVERAVTADTNKAGSKIKTKSGKIFVDKGDTNVVDLVNDYMDYFYGYSTRKEEGVFGKTYTRKEQVTKKELEDAIQANIDAFSEDRAQIEEAIKTADEGNKVKLQSELSALEDSFKDINSRLYKQLENLGGNKVASRAVDALLKYNQIVRIGYNMVAPINNYVAGHLNLYIEASDGRRFNTKELNRSMKLTTGAIAHSVTFGLADTKDGNKIRNFMYKFNVLKDSKNEIFTFNHNTTGLLGILAPHNLTSRIEYLNQSNTMVPVLLHTKVTLSDGTVTNYYDAADEHGDLPEGAVISDSIGDIDETILKIKIDEAIRTVHGNYDPDSKLMYKNTVIGRVLGQFRNWAFMGFNERFGAKGYNELARLEKKGRYRSYGALYNAQEGNLKVFKTLITVSQQLLRKVASAPVLNKLTGIEGTTFQEIDGLSETDQANLRKNMTEIIILLMAAGAVLLLDALFMDDDDDDSVLERMAIMALVNTIDRTSTDLWFYTSPAAFQELNKSILPLSGLLTDALKLGNSITNRISGEESEYQSGIYSGYDKSIISLAKLAPVSAQVLRAQGYVSRELNPN